MGRGTQKGSDCNAERQLRKTGTGERRKCLYQLLKKRKAHVWVAKTLPYQIKSRGPTPFYTLPLARRPLMTYCALWLPQFIHIRVYHPVCKAQQVASHISLDFHSDHFPLKDFSPVSKTSWLTLSPKGCCCPFFNSLEAGEWRRGVRKSLVS